MRLTVSAKSGLNDKCDPLCFISIALNVLIEVTNLRIWTQATSTRPTFNLTSRANKDLTVGAELWPGNSSRSDWTS